VLYEEMFDPGVLSLIARAAKADGFVITTTALSTGGPVKILSTAALE